MPLLTSLDNSQLLIHTKKNKLSSGKKKSLLKKKKLLRKKRLQKEKLKREMRIEKLLSLKEEEVQERSADKKKIREIEAREKQKEKEALESLEETPQGLVGKVFGTIGNAIGLNTKKEVSFTPEGIGDSLKEVIDETATSVKKEGSFFTDVGKNLFNSYAGVGKDLINSVTGVKNTVTNKNNLATCDGNFIDNFDTLYLGCDRTNLINVYNLTVEGLKKRINFFPRDTKDQIKLLEPLEFTPENNPIRIKESLQKGGTKKNFLKKSLYQKQNKTKQKTSKQNKKLVNKIKKIKKKALKKKIN